MMTIKCHLSRALLLLGVSQKLWTFLSPSDTSINFNKKNLACSIVRRRVTNIYNDDRNVKQLLRRFPKHEVEFIFCTDEKIFTVDSPWIGKRSSRPIRFRHGQKAWRQCKPSVTGHNASCMSIMPRSECRLALCPQSQCPLNINNITDKMPPCHLNRYLYLLPGPTDAWRIVVRQRVRRKQVCRSNSDCTQRRELVRLGICGAWAARHFEVRWGTVSRPTPEPILTLVT